MRPGLRGSAWCWSLRAFGRSKRQTHSTQAGGEKFKKVIYFECVPFWAKQMWKSTSEEPRECFILCQTLSLEMLQLTKKKSPRESPIFLYYPASPTNARIRFRNRATHTLGIAGVGFGASLWCYHGHLSERGSPLGSVWTVSPECQSACHQHMRALTLTSRSASTRLQPPPRGTCPWQEAASAELKTIRVDQKKCRVGWRAGQILISTCWPHASLHMSHPTELMLFGLGFYRRGLPSLHRAAERRGRKLGCGLDVVAQVPGRRQLAP